MELKMGSLLFMLETEKVPDAWKRSRSPINGVETWLNLHNLAISRVIKSGWRRVYTIPSVGMLTTAFCCILTEHQSYAILTAFHKHQREFEKTKQIEKNVEAQRNMFPQQKCGPLNCTGRSQLSVTTLPTMNVASSNPLTGHVMSQNASVGQGTIGIALWNCRSRLFQSSSARVRRKKTCPYMLQYWRWCQQNVGMMLRHFGPIHHPRPATCKYSHIPRGRKSHRKTWKILQEGRQESIWKAAPRIQGTAQYGRFFLCSPTAQHHAQSQEFLKRFETVVALSDSSKANVSFISVSLHDERFQMLCCSWARHGTTITRNLQHYLQSIHVESCWTVETLGVDSKHCQNMPKCKVDVAPPCATMDPWSHHPPFACIHTSCAGRNL